MIRAGISRGQWPRVALALACWLLGAGAVFAVSPSERLADPALEARAREISRELRCVVCQNQSIDDSEADLARDLRLLVRERLTAGDSDQAVFSYLTDRYGAFVLLRPPLTAATVALWAAPAIVLLIGLLAAAAYVRQRRSGAAGTELSPAELTGAELEELERALDRTRVGP